MLINENGGTRFIKYDNIHVVKLPVLKLQKWVISVIYTSECAGRTSYDFSFKTEEVANVRYKEIVDNCANHYKRARFLEERLEKLFSLIEVLPGGEEYEKAKDRFQNKTD